MHKYPPNQSSVGSSGHTLTTNVSMTLLFIGSDQDELASPVPFRVLEITSRNQGSQSSSATMIPQ